MWWLDTSILFAHLLFEAFLHFLTARCRNNNRRLATHCFKVELLGGCLLLPANHIAGYMRILVGGGWLVAYVLNSSAFVLRTVIEMLPLARLFTVG